MIHKDLFDRKSSSDSHFLSTHVQKDLILYIIMKKILMIYISAERIIFISVCWRNFSDVMPCSFHFERFISQKKTHLIHTSPKWFIIYIKCNPYVVFVMKDWFDRKSSSDSHFHRRISSSFLHIYRRISSWI